MANGITPLEETETTFPGEFDTGGKIETPPIEPVIPTIKDAGAPAGFSFGDGIDKSRPDALLDTLKDLKISDAPAPIGIAPAPAPAAQVSSQITAPAETVPIKKEEPAAAKPTSEVFTPVAEKEKPAKEKEVAEAPTTTPTELDKIIAKLPDDIDLAGLEFIAAMMAGEDPLAEAAFNFEVGKLGPLWEAQNAALSMKLKQLGIEGKNAGTAWLANMAQRQGVELSQITSRLSFESAQRIMNMNIKGPEHANRIINNRLNRDINQYNFGIQQISDQVELGNTDPQAYVNIAAANGVTMTPETARFVADNVTSQNEADRLAALREINSNYLEIETSMENMVPGLSVDGSAVNSLTPEQQNDLRNRVKAIYNALRTNKVALAQDLMQELKGLYPNSVPGDYSNWNPADFRTWGGQQAMNEWTLEAKKQFDNENTNEAIQILINRVIDPLTADENFSDLWGTSADERKDKAMELAGLDGDPISTDDKLAYIAADRLLGMDKTTIDEIFKSYYENSPAHIKEWLLDPQNAEITKAWIFDVTAGPYEKDENGMISLVAGQQLPPWNADSINAHYFTDWAMADSFNKEDGSLNITYDGGNAYEDDNGFQTSEGYANYRKQMDDAWESYKNNRGELDRRRWFDSVKPVWDGESVVFNGEAQKTFDEDEPVDPVTKRANLAERVAVGDSLTVEEITSIIPNITIQNIPINSGEVEAFIAANSDIGNWINVGGVPLKVVESVRGLPAGPSARHKDVIVIEDFEGNTFHLKKLGSGERVWLELTSDGWYRPRANAGPEL